MIKLEIDENDIRLETAGPVIDIAAEIGILINSIYCGLVRRRFSTAAAFKALVKSSIADPNGPIWQDDGLVGDVDIAAIIPKKRKKGD